MWVLGVTAPSLNFPRLPLVTRNESPRLVTNSQSPLEILVQNGFRVYNTRALTPYLSVWEKLATTQWFAVFSLLRER
jgi:hypothetical protein